MLFRSAPVPPFASVPKQKRRQPLLRSLSPPPFLTKSSTKGISLKSSKIEAVLITCEVCKKEVEFEKYVEHSKTHKSPPPSVGPVSIIDLPSNESQLTRAAFTGKGGEKTCKICYVDYKLDDTLIYLPCLNVYHEGCILDWINRVFAQEGIPTCPICQKQMFNSQD